MEALFTSTPSLLAIMMLTIAFTFYLQRFKKLKTLGPALIVVLISIIVANLRIVPFEAEIYDSISDYAVPLAISMLLLSVDLKKMASLSKKPLLAMILAVISVSFIAVISGLFFAPVIHEGWKIAGMFIGTYTGGSPNLTAIGYGLDASSTTFAAANAADYVVGTPALILLLTLPTIAKNSKRFQKVWPFSLSQQELEDDHAENEDSLMEDKKWSIQDIVWCLTLGFIITALSAFLSKYFPDSFESAVKILFISTLAVIAAQFKPVKNLKGNMDLGLFAALLFLTTIGYSVNIMEFVGSTLVIALFCLVVILGSLILHALLCRLFKIDYQYVIISMVAAIWDGPTSSLVAVSENWKSLVSLAVILGVMGDVLGNYAGIGTAYLIKFMIGA